MKKAVNGKLVVKQGWEGGPTLYLDEEQLCDLLDKFLEKYVEITVVTKPRGDE